MLLENLLRTEDGANITADDVRAARRLGPRGRAEPEIQYTPARVIMQDFTGVPCIVDLAAMREAMTDLGGDPQKINPLAPAELVIDHSVIADVFGPPRRLRAQRRRSSSTATRSATSSCAGARTRSTTSRSSRRTPASSTRSTSSGWRASCSPTSPGQGLPRHPRRHRLAHHDDQRPRRARLGRRRHRGRGRDARPAGPMLIPKVVGFKLTGEQPAGTTATDLVLTVTELLRQHGVVGKFVEFYGDGVAACRSPTAPPSAT